MGKQSVPTKKNSKFHERHDYSCYNQDMIIYRILSTILFLLALPVYMAVRKIEGKSFGWKEKFGDFQVQ